MTLEELKAALEAAKVKSEVIDSVVTLIEEEKQRGISTASKKNKEAEGLRKFKLAMESLGYDGVGDLDQFTSSVISKTKPDDGGTSLTLKALNTKIQTLESSLKTEKERADKASFQARNKTIQSKLTSLLSDKVYAHDLLIKDLINDGRVDLDGENIIFKNGDEISDCDTGLKKLLESRKDIVKTTQSAGSGSKPGQQIPNDINEILNSKDTNTIANNIDKVKQYYGIK